MSGIAEPPACSLPASVDLWTSAAQPQTPLVSGVAPAMAQTAWKIMHTSEQQAARLAGVPELYFRFQVGWRTTEDVLVCLHLVRGSTQD